ncbi:hypothetical protein [Bifidobacterium sp. ESL0745]|uniref:hypothetical protein n=1 Tax=Bifidobacterium sp. ESL0745 TaxID=2983226 RepID=UPI0023F6DCEC|nr:hypothetical protein [Bifidobacterium sp. ESL0745]MDF7664556.1 hypothetical protein [Bifidobacterium sp. ESL0745]
MFEDACASAETGTLEGAVAPVEVEVLAGVESFAGVGAEALVGVEVLVPDMTGWLALVVSCVTELFTFVVPVVDATDSCSGDCCAGVVPEVAEAGEAVLLVVAALAAGAPITSNERTEMETAILPKNLPCLILSPRYLIKLLHVIHSLIATIPFYKYKSIA